MSIGPERQPDLERGITFAFIGGTALILAAAFAAETGRFWVAGGCFLVGASFVALALIAASQVGDET